MMNTTIKSYKFTPSANIILIPINRIELQPSMMKSLTGINSISNPIKNRAETVGNLERLESMKNAFENEADLPPVELQFHEGRKEGLSYVPPSQRAKRIIPRVIPATESTYSIINGRHRVVYSLLFGMTHIPAIIN